MVLRFHIYSLELMGGINAHELESIKKIRPQANLNAFNLSQLKSLKEKNELNKLLQKKFEDVFLSIFEDLGIEG